jgi:translation initiation factor 2B subunit (eIF-2B alpha/beta/delta family)
MSERHVVAAFCRDGGEVLLVRRSDDASPGRWDVPAGDAGNEIDRERVVRAAIHEATDLSSEAVTLVHGGEPIRVGSEDSEADPDRADSTDHADENCRTVHPFLFDVAIREVTASSGAAHEWVPPTEIRRRATVPWLWRAYERVAPSIETIETDRERGSAALSVSALRALRDRAGVLADRMGDDRSREKRPDGDRSVSAAAEASAAPESGDTEGDPAAGNGWRELATTARRLRDARPAMVVVGNRVNRAMASADERSPRGVERATQHAIERAASADTEAATVATEVLAERSHGGDGSDDSGPNSDGPGDYSNVADSRDGAGDGRSDGDVAAVSAGPRVLTLSRSGTVLETIRRLDPPPREVVIAESRPGGEGVGVAEELAPDYPTTLVADAGVASALRDLAVDAVLVGADTVFRDGSVSNKVGTRGTALAAAHEGVPVYVVAASAKVSPDFPIEADTEARDATELYDGPLSDADLDVRNPTFDVTPGEAVTGIATERGVLGSEAVAAIAEEFADIAAWDDRDGV